MGNPQGSRSCVGVFLLFFFFFLIFNELVPVFGGRGGEKQH